MSETPTDRAAELLRLRERATAGEWDVYCNTVQSGNPKGQDVRSSLFPSSRVCENATVKDVEFIAYAANHAAAIVAEMQGEIERLRAALQNVIEITHPASVHNEHAVACRSEAIAALYPREQPHD